MVRAAGWYPAHVGSIPIPHPPNLGLLLYICQGGRCSPVRPEVEFQSERAARISSFRNVVPTHGGAA
jgi:hypothetical protein